MNMGFLSRPSLPGNGCSTLFNHIMGDRNEKALDSYIHQKPCGGSVRGAGNFKMADFTGAGGGNRTPTSTRETGF